MTANAESSVPEQATAKMLTLGDELRIGAAICYLPVLLFGPVALAAKPAVIAYLAVLLGSVLWPVVRKLSNRPPSAGLVGDLWVTFLGMRQVARNDRALARAGKPCPEPVVAHITRPRFDVTLDLDDVPALQGFATLGTNVSEARVSTSDIIMQSTPKPEHALASDIKPGDSILSFSGRPDRVARVVPNPDGTLRIVPENLWAIVCKPTDQVVIVRGSH